jgi:hypothetical protein
MVLLTGHDVAGMMFFLVNASTEKLPCLWRPIWLIELIKLIEFIELNKFTGLNRYQPLTLIT